MSKVVILRSRKFFLFLFFLCLTIFINYGSFSSKFGPIDDHELATFLKNGERLSLKDIPINLFRNTEVGNLGKGERFRWLYWTQRLVELSIFGDNAGLMYAVRTLIVAASAIVLFLVVLELQSNDEDGEDNRARLHHLTALLLPTCAGIWFLCLPSSVNGLARIGTQEPALSLGVLLVVLGAVRLFKRHSLHRELSHVIVALGAIIATGFKENGLVVVPVLLICFLYPFANKSKLTNCFYYSALVSIGLLSYHTFRVFLRGSDVYGNDRGVFSIVESVLLEIKSPQFTLAIVCFLLILTIFFNDPSNYRAQTIVGLMLFMGLVMLSEAIFYGQDSPVIRYHALSDIALIMIVVVAFQSIIHTICSTHKRNSFSFFAAHLITVCCLLVYLNPIQLFSQVREASYSLSSSTRSYQNGIDEIATELNSKPNSSFVVYLFDTAADVEPAVAMISYLRMKGVKNEFYLTVREKDIFPSDLLNSYSQISIEGSAQLTISKWLYLVRSKTDICYSPNYGLFNPSVPESTEVKAYCS